MSNYFRRVPNFEYISRNPNEKNISDYVPVKNLFKRGKLREDIFGNLAFFEKYSIIGDERPDNVAFKVYGDESLDWVVLISNNILNIYSEWPMTQRTFEKVMLEKYGSYENFYAGIHHYETEEIKNSSGVIVLKEGLEINPTWETNGNFIKSINSKITSITVTGKTVRVGIKDNIPGMFVNSQVVIDGISVRDYNGKFLVTSVFDKEFTYELTSEPRNSNPTLIDPKVLLIINDDPSKLIGVISDPSDQLLQDEFPNAISGDIITDSETGEIWIYNGYSWVEESTIKSLYAYYYEYYDSDLGQLVQVPSINFIREVTNFEYENQIEEEKRNIFILKPRYLNIVFDDIEDIMTYKTGGDQYVNPTLKRADNIRLYY
jgi:hypothetical protein